MGILKRVWDYSGWIIGGYTLYKQLQSMSAAKNDLYAALSDDQKKEWNAIFGDPTIQPQVTAQPMPTVTMPPAAAVAASTQQIQAVTSQTAPAVQLVAGT